MTGPARKPRLCIFVIAYYAEKTLSWVLGRIPEHIFTDFDCEILIVDDASEDRTFAIGREWKAAHPELRLTVLRNEYNQGYGGNQKVGYTYAVNEGFDLVAMVHGDGQYAPEELPRLIAPIVADEADAVFGSRMMTWFGALKGGMPLYKYVGNRILTTAQNAVLGTKLSEFHSGYRIYSTRALKRLRYKLNNNDFHFDTEIIIQLVNADLRVLELPIPTYYGTEISRVNGMKYAKDVMVQTVRNAVHRAGLLYDVQFDPITEGAGNAHYDLKLGYPSSHQLALDAVPNGARVIDIGGGPGGIAAELKKKGCQVQVVDQYQPEVAPEGISVTVQDLDEPPRFDVGDAEVMTLLDVIEHLKDPEGFFAELRKQFTHTPKTLVLTTPNIAFAVQRGMLLLGQFNYGKAGILDRTHTRLFTFGSIERLLKNAGFRIKEVRGVPAPFPKVFGSGVLARGLLAANQAGIALSKSLFAYQIFIVAESTPDTDFVLADTRQRSVERAARSETSARRDEGRVRARRDDVG